MSEELSMTEDERELLKLRTDYAFKWFDLHAKQRMTLFNYFLIIAGILANGLLLSFKDDKAAGGAPPTAVAQTATTLPATLPSSVVVVQNNYAGPSPAAPPATSGVSQMKIVRIGIGLLGCLAAAVFIMFDVRSRDLTARSEDALERLEREHLFPDGYNLKVNSAVDPVDIQLGMLRVQRDAKMREGQKRDWKANLLKMKWWIWILEGLVGVGFAASIFL